MVPLTVDGLIYSSSMVMLDSARQGSGSGVGKLTVHPLETLHETILPGNRTLDLQDALA
jgi:hypothetical protein